VSTAALGWFVREEKLVHHLSDPHCFRSSSALHEQEVLVPNHPIYFVNDPTEVLVLLDWKEVLIEKMEWKLSQG